MLLLENYTVDNDGTIGLMLSSYMCKKLGVIVTDKEILLVHYESGEIRIVTKSNRPNTDHIVYSCGYELTNDELRDLRNLLRVVYKPNFIKVLNNPSFKVGCLNNGKLFAILLTDSRHAYKK